MRNFLVAAGVAASLMFASYLAFTPATDAGWGPPFACGAGPNTGSIGWDDSIPEPGAQKPVLTGILSEGDEEADAAQEWTIDELKAAKPLMVYRYIDNLMDASDENYKFSQSFEVKILAKEKVIEKINANWMCKRSPIDIEADRKDKKNQSSIVFYAFTGQKMGELGLKSRMSSRNFLTTLSKFEKNNKLLCGKEIKRLEKIAKDEETASK